MIKNYHTCNIKVLQKKQEDTVVIAVRNFFDRKAQTTEKLNCNKSIKQTKLIIRFN